MISNLFIDREKQYIADTLSRACVNNKVDSQLEKECESNMHLHINSIDSTDGSIQKIKDESERDPCLAKILNYCSSKWPDNKAECDPNVMPYWQLRNHLSIHNNMIVYNNRIVIPKSLKKIVLVQIHNDHQGIVCCKALARPSVFWVNIKKTLKMLFKVAQHDYIYVNFQTKWF